MFWIRSCYAKDDGGPSQTSVATFTTQPVIHYLFVSTIIVGSVFIRHGYTSDFTLVRIKSRQEPGIRCNEVSAQINHFKL
jgi:hypothetical protein